MTFKEALDIVLELANQNTIGVSDAEDHYGLYLERERQLEAIDIVDKLYADKEIWKTLDKL